MINFTEACKQAGYDKSKNTENDPGLEYFWVAYKNGESKKFATKNEALVCSKNVEKCVTKESALARAKYWDNLQTLEQKAYAIWEDALRVEYADLPVKMFYTLFSFAYERGHHAGHDEVANYMIDEYNKAIKIIRLANVLKMTTI